MATEPSGPLNNPSPARAIHKSTPESLENARPKMRDSVSQSIIQGSFRVILCLCLILGL